MSARLDRCDFDQCASVHLHLCDFCEKKRSCNEFSCLDESIRPCDRCQSVFDTVFAWLSQLDNKTLRTVYADLVDDTLATRHKNCPHAEYMRRLYREAANGVMKYTIKDLYGVPKRIRQRWDARLVVADALETLPIVRL